MDEANIDKMIDFVHQIAAINGVRLPSDACIPAKKPRVAELEEVQKEYKER